VLDWRPGDVVLFDNLQTQHSVTPTDACACAALPDTHSVGRAHSGPWL
jgi:hypothetical protein